MTYTKKIALLDDFLDFSFLLSAFGLLTDVELFDDSTIALDVFAFEIIEHATTLTYQCRQSALGTEVLAVVFEVLGEVVDTESEECDLALSATGVLGVFAVLSEELSFFL